MTKGETLVGNGTGRQDPGDFTVTRDHLQQLWSSSNLTSVVRDATSLAGCVVVALSHACRTRRYALARIGVCLTCAVSRAPVG